MAPDDEEPTRPGTPDAKRRESAQFARVSAENALLVKRVAELERKARFLESRVDALVLRVQRVEGEQR